MRTRTESHGKRTNRLRGKQTSVGAEGFYKKIMKETENIRKDLEIHIGGSEMKMSEIQTDTV